MIEFTTKNIAIITIFVAIGIVISAIYSFETFIFSVIILLVAYYPNNTPLHFIN